MNTTLRYSLLALFVVAAGPVWSQNHAIRAGALGTGATEAAGPNHAVRGTVGLLAVGRVAGPNHAVGGGLWYQVPEGEPPPPGGDPPLWLSFAPDPTAYPDTLAVTVLAGDPTAPVTDLFGLGFRLAYDPERFAFLGAAPGPFLDDGDLLAFAEAGPDFVAYSLSRRRGASGVSGHGVVAVLRFLTLPADAVATATFTPSDVLAVDPAGGLIPLVPVPGEVTVEPRFLVWPGDTDDSGLVEAADLLPIGLYFGLTGPVRGPLDFTWEGQPAEPWEPEAATFADAAADGVISQNDLLPVGLNYGLTQAPRRPGEPPGEEAPPALVVRGRTAREGGARVADTRSAGVVAPPGEEGLPLAVASVPPMPAGTRYRLDLAVGDPTGAPRALLGAAARWALPPALALDALAPGRWLDDGDLLAFDAYDPGGALDAAYSRKRGRAPALGHGPAIALTLAVAAEMSTPAEVVLHAVKGSAPAEGIRALGPGEAALVTPLAVTAEPVGGPVVIGPGGGTFRVRVALRNTAGEPLDIQVWAGASGPVTAYPLGVPVALTLGPGATASRTLTQRVPAGAPPGEYTYAAFGGPTTAFVLGGASFPFTKVGGGARQPVERGTGAAWPAAQWDEAGWAVTEPGVGEASGVTIGSPSSTAALSEGAPEVPALHAARPNPSHGRTALRYDVAEAGRVRLAVYDALGREVAVLVEGERDPGRHEVVLDGRGFPSGTYLVRMTTGSGFVQTRTVTLFR